MKKLTFVRMCQLCAVFVSLLLFTICASATAQTRANTTSGSERSVKQEARQQFDKGLQRFSEKLYAEAADHFSRAYELSGEPDILYNLGRCHEAREQNGQAIESYESYLEKRPDADDRDEVERRIAYLRTGENYQDASIHEDTVGTTANGSDDSAKGDKKKDSGSEKQSRSDKSSSAPVFAISMYLGPGFIIRSPELKADNSPRHPYFSYDAMLHVRFNSWLALTFQLAIAGYMERNAPFTLGDAKTHVGLGAGVTLMKQLGQERLSLYGRFAVIPIAVNRYKFHDRATWIDFEGAIGLDIRLSKSWSINVEAFADAGPSFIVRSEFSDPWKTGLLLSAGGRVGATVTF